MAIKFLGQSQSVEVTRTVAPQLVAMKKYSAVGAGSCHSRSSGRKGELHPEGQGTSWDGGGRDYPESGSAEASERTKEGKRSSPRIVCEHQAMREGRK